MLNDCEFSFEKKLIKMRSLQLKLITFSAFVLILFSTVASQTVATDAQDEGRRYSLLMPDVQPFKQDINFCTAFQVPDTDYEYIVEFIPSIDIHSTNHMLLYGCEVPGRLQEGGPRTVWDCGETSGPKSDILPSGPVCSSGMQILYSWSKDSPALHLPDGVGFKIGKGTGINYLVLKVYYADISKILNGGTDNSGITITVLPSTTNKITKKAGLYLLKTGGVIRSGTAENFECACTIDEQVHMHPFAFRPHAHALGKAVSAYKIDKEGNWILIGKGSPRKPMKFYTVKNSSIVLEDGDRVAARCTMYNFRERDTYIGPTDHDEMCMFYMMYYVDGDQPLDHTGGCSSSGPPTYYWSKDPKIEVPSYIDKEASDPEY